MRPELRVLSRGRRFGRGQFLVEDLQLGEEFVRYDGSLARLCEEQPYRQPGPIGKRPYLPDHFLVWVRCGTAKAMRVFLHRTSRAGALTPEQAQSIEQRKAARKQ
jgi:hypothetical protein